MEDALRVQPQVQHRSPATVLILVLMEDALRDEDNLVARF